MMRRSSGAHERTSRNTSSNRKMRRKDSRFSNVERPNSEAPQPYMFTFARQRNTRHRKLKSWSYTEFQRGLDRRSTSSCCEPRPNFTVETMPFIFKSEKG